MRAPIDLHCGYWNNSVNVLLVTLLVRHAYGPRALLIAGGRGISRPQAESSVCGTPTYNMNVFLLSRHIHTSKALPIAGGRGTLRPQARVVSVGLTDTLQ